MKRNVNNDVTKDSPICALGGYWNKVCNVLSLLLHATISVYGLLNLTNRDLLPVSIDLFHVLQFERSDCAIFSKLYLTCQLFIIYTVF